MRIALLLMTLLGCDDSAQMMSYNDMTVVPLDDLAVMQCAGAAGTCQGMPCGSGCKCEVVAQINSTDAGEMAGAPLGVCLCSPVVEFDGPIACCGGVACLLKSSASPTCNGSDCAAAP